MSNSGKTVKNIDEIDDISEMVDTMRALRISAKGLKTLDEMKLKVRTEMKKPELSTTAEKAFSIISETKAAEDVKKRETLKEFYANAGSFLDRLDDNILSLLQEYMGDVKENVKQHMHQLSQEKYFLLVAGETSSGKSSLINLILREEILPSAHIRTTATICEVKFGTERRLVVHFLDKDSEEISLKQPTRSSEPSYQEQISCYAGIKSDDHAKGTSIKKIELFWPHSLLKKGIVIVDSPGVGESDEMDEIVIQYLPEAFAFIYVINAANADGIQKDRLLKLFEKVKEVSLGIQKEKTDGSKMASKLSVLLLSKCALFVCNKWDQVEKLPENQIESVKNEVRKKLERVWPGFDPESQIIYMSATEAATVQNYGYFMKPFSSLMNGLSSMISESIDARLELHWKLLYGLHSRLFFQAKAFVKTCQNTNQKMRQIVARLDIIKKQQDKGIADLRKYWDKSVDDAVRQLSEYLSSEEVIARFTSWTPDKVPEKQNSWKETQLLITEALSSRLREVIEEWEEDNRVFAKASDSLKQQCLEFHGNVASQLRYLQRAATDDSDYLDTTNKSFFPRLTTTKKAFIAGVVAAVAISIVNPIFLPDLIFTLSAGIPFLFLPELKDMWNSLKYQTDQCAFMANASKDYLAAVANEKELKEFVQNHLKYAMVYLEEIKAHLQGLIKADERLYAQLESSQKEQEKLQELYRPILDEVSQHRSNVALFGITDGCAIDVSHEALDWKEDVPSCLGNGSFGAVYQGQMRRHGEVQTVALKVWKEVLDLNNVSQIMDEIDHLREFDHLHIVKFYGISLLKKMDTVRLILVMEKCRENLASHIFKDPRSAPGKSEDRAVVIEICRLAKEITDGVAYIHDQRLVHRDLKPENILLSQENSVRIADVGLAKQTVNITGTVTGTPLYMAPEVFHSQKYGTKADIYSLGIILWEMWYGQRAFAEFSGEPLQEFFLHVDNSKRPEDRNGCKEPPFHSLMTRCWDGNPEKRPTAKECKTKTVMLQVRLVAEVYDAISPQELDCTEDMSSCLGGGAFGDVYPGMLRKRGDVPHDKIPVALKFCKQELDVSMATQIIQEITTPLRSLKHPNIVQFLGISLLVNEDLVRIILVMEKCKENLDSRICRDPKSVPGKSENTDVAKGVCQWVQEITNGLAYIHDRGIVHRNLKLENILLSEDDSVRIADVGLAKPAADINGNVVETHVYMAPEVFHSWRYDSKTDIYSLGIIMWEMWYGQRAFADCQWRRSQDLFNWVDTGNRPVDTKGCNPPPYLWEHLMTQCWKGNPAERPTAEECNKNIKFGNLGILAKGL